MKYTILLALSLMTSFAFASDAHTWRECYDALDGKHSDKAVLFDNDNALNAMLESMVKQARFACKEGPQFGSCLGGFIDKIDHCDGVGNKHLQTYVEELRRSAEVHAAPVQGKPVQVSEDKGGRK